MVIIMFQLTSIFIPVRTAIIKIPTKSDNYSHSEITWHETWYTHVRIKHNTNSIFDGAIYNNKKTKNRKMSKAIMNAYVE